MEADRFVRAVAAIDAANAGDPNVLEVRGTLRPKELAHAELATEWVRRLAPDAGEALLLATRAHHLRRWRIPRAEYPEGRAGYLRWKRDLQRFHADEVARILLDVGYDPATVDRVGALVRKAGLGRDPEVQVLEDALCLVFAETQLAELAGRLDRDKMVDVVRKTLAKMSDRAKVAALELDLTAEERALLDDALADSS